MKSQVIQPGTVPMSCTEGRAGLTTLVWQEEWTEYCRRRLRRNVDRNALISLADLCLLPTYERDDRVAALAGDLQAVACPVHARRTLAGLFDSLDSLSLPADILAVAPSGTTLLEVPRWPDDPLPPEFFASGKNLVAASLREHQDNLEHPQKRAYFGAAALSSRSQELLEHATAQENLARRIRGDQSTWFANSAYYMGSKRSLGAFITESLRNVLNDGDVVLDLMCGSGAASKALSYCWKTIASDVLEFCVVLARALGAGYSVRQATRKLDALTGHVRKNAEALCHLMDPLLAQEDDFLHSELNERKILDYIQFVDETPRYPEGGTSGQWRPCEAVTARQNISTEDPYCLVSAYFANVYFGVRQSIEIDSIRYAIDRLDSAADRTFALAALVAACSQLGSGYAGQFAQPVRLTEAKVPKAINKRAQSLFHEFSVRFAALAAESEKSPHEITTVRGGWQEVLAEVANWQNDRPSAVYLDAPYTREEYSRYYHVLETIVRYNYPSSLRRGRLPDRTKGEYFTSPFFTRNLGGVTREIVSIIQAVLERGWVCAWSYSDQGVADILDVIEDISNLVEADVISYSTPHQYKAQGRRGAKRAKEYCIIFAPKGKRGRVR